MSGVTIPVGQRRSKRGVRRADPGQITGAAPVELVAVSYGNPEGVVVDELWLRVGEKYYRNPQTAESALSELRQVTDKVAAQLDAVRGVLSKRAQSSSALVDEAAGETVEELTTGIA